MGSTYEHFATHAGDLLLATKDPEAFTEILQREPFHFKFKGPSEIDSQLGADFGLKSKRGFTGHKLNHFIPLPISQTQLDHLKATRGMSKN